MVAVKYLNFSNQNHNYYLHLLAYFAGKIKFGKLRELVEDERGRRIGYYKCSN